VKARSWHPEPGDWRIQALGPAKRAAPDRTRGNLHRSQGRLAEDANVSRPGNLIVEAAGRIVIVIPWRNQDGHVAEPGKGRAQDLAERGGCALALEEIPGDTQRVDLPRPRQIDHPAQRRGQLAPPLSTATRPQPFERPLQMNVGYMEQAHASPQVVQRFDWLAGAATNDPAVRRRQSRPRSAQHRAKPAANIGNLKP
jgi:hypothetical protein